MGFEEALKKDGDRTILSISVSANAKKTRIPHAYNEWRKAIEVRIKSPARDNKANREIISEMEKIFGVEVEILKGEKSSNKVIRVHLSYDRVVEILKRRFENEAEL
ncbi:TIGR00251 family protein [Archaeoglobus sulfaticallidus PM70-1]|uniref:UPF0235 protein Asulf_00758 n=1 Tax=Archaeoglobus sulfaticallidus PM70-1 TaxID=387631 RepID=N0BJU4_9EURY|nr:DUF167 family protein [Archaeoglobus sulfaticallidus]AGK60771.1 TIGR00251 family protein [Archaeoglobus sulfaticallidus PM70-1]